MAVAVASSSSTAYANANSVVVGKPTGLAVGDLILAAVHWMNTAVVTPPSGFTVIDSDIGGSIHTNTYWKVATSADVAATTFTFSLDATVQVSGGILRVTGSYTVSPIGAFQSSTSSGTSLSYSGITPNVTNCLLVIFTSTTGANATASGYAVTTSDPGGWSEAYDTSNANGALSCASVVRPAKTGTGNWTLTTTVSGNTGATVIAIDGRFLVDISESLSGVTDTLNSGPGVTLSDQTSATDSVTQNNQEWSNPQSKDNASPANSTKNSVNPANSTKNNVTFVNSVKN